MIALKNSSYFHYSNSHNIKNRIDLSQASWTILKKSPRSSRRSPPRASPNNVLYTFRLLLCLAPIKFFFASKFSLLKNDTQSKKKREAARKKVFLNVRKVCFYYFHPKDFRYKNKTWDSMENSLLLSTARETLS